ncbi:MAG TPA: deoxyribose-phosphate aldolase [Streptosporangiaceae bacterium]|nr:deoxyribose-phosphate aldolase [Streptosporangiaceae bacterium]
MTGAPSLTRNELAAMIDHTLLTPEATERDVVAFCGEARNLGVYAVCVSPTMAAVAAREVAGAPIAVAAVAGFPSGAHNAGIKAAEAAEAAAAGAAEIDMVINLGLAKDGRWAEVEEEIRTVRESVAATVVLKVIIETGILDPNETAAACQAAEAAGADYVKTSTGFHPSGGATTDAVALMAKTVGTRLGVKASGGIRSASSALAMVQAGATRLGLSRSAAILAELPSGPE